MPRVLVQSFLPSERTAVFPEPYRVKGNGLLYPKPSDLRVCQVLCNLPFHNSSHYLCDGVYHAGTAHH